MQIFNESAKNKPRFHSYFGFITPVVKSLFNGNIEQPLKYSLNKGLYKAIFSSRRLLLGRMVKFNGKYFSSVSIPAFPSKAYNNMFRNGGLNFQEAGTPAKRHFETALLGIADSCPLNCRHCYEKYNLAEGNSVPLVTWKNVISELQKRGVSIIVLTGGEPLVKFNDTLELLNSGNKELSDFHLHTSGYSLTFEKAAALKEAGLMAAAIGLDDYDPVRNDRIRGKGSFNTAIEALKIFNKAGILTYINLCATKELINDGNLYVFYNFLKSLNISFIQLLEPRPCGGYLNEQESILGNEEKRKLKSFVKNVSRHKLYKDHPVIYYVAHIEDKEQNGCNMGGLSILYIDTAGNVNPCVFVPVSFGNIVDEEIDSIMEKMRTAVPHPIKKDCPSILLSAKIKELHASTGKLPVTYSDLESEWKSTLYNNYREH